MLVSWIVHDYSRRGKLRRSLCQEVPGAKLSQLIPGYVAASVLAFHGPSPSLYWGAFSMGSQDNVTTSL